MICGVLDPYLLAAPTEDCSAQEVLFFASSIARWRSTLAKEQFHFCMSQHCLQALGEAGVFPTIDVLRRRLSARGINQFDALTLFQIIAWFFSRARDLSQVAGISEILFDADGLVLDVPWLVDRLAPGVQPVLKHCLAICATARLAQVPNSTGLILFSAAQDAADPLSATVSFRLEDCDYPEGYAGKAVPCPCQVGQPVPLAFVPEQVLDHVQIAEIWQNAELAVQWGYRRAIPQYERGHWPLLSFLVHPEFARTVRQHMLTENELAIVFRRAALLISRRGLQLRGLHPHALLADGAQRIRARDGATAMRMQVEQHGRGLQLHYWQLGEGLVELASLNSHADPSIPE